MGAMKDKLKGKAKKIEGELLEKKGQLESRASRVKNRVKARIDEARMKRAAKKAAR